MDTVNITETIKKSVYTQKFNRTVMDFIQDLKSIFPKEINSLVDENLETNFKDSLGVSQEWHAEFYKNVEPIAQEFSMKNEIVFSSDIQLLNGIKFHHIWNHSQLEKVDEETLRIKENIWKYLHKMYLYAYCFQENVEIKEVMNDYKQALDKVDPEQLESQAKILYCIMDNLYKKKKKESPAEEMGEDDIFKEGKGDESNSKNGMPDLSNIFKSVAGNLGGLGDLGDLGDLGKLAGGDPSKLAETMFNGKIGQLACDIAKDIDPNSLDLNLENPGDLLDPLLSGLKGDTSKLESSPIFGIVNQITEKLQTKLNSGEVNEKELFSEAQGMMDGLGLQDGDSPQDVADNSKNIARELLKKKRKNRKKIIRNKKRK